MLGKRQTLSAERVAWGSVRHGDTAWARGLALACEQVTPNTETRRVPTGTIVVRTGQPLGNLIVYLLEPECEDGLTTWNYFDQQLKAGADFPVLRVLVAQASDGTGSSKRPE